MLLVFRRNQQDSLEGQGRRTDMTNSWMPTRKWWAALAGSAATLLAHFAATDFTFGDTEQGMVVTAISALVLAYLRRNEPTPGGVPVEKVR